MIGERLKKFRKERGLTQGQLGKGILSVSYISQIENNNLPIPDYLLEEIAQRLQITTEQLLGIDEEKKVEEIQKRIDETLIALYHMRYDEVDAGIVGLSAEIAQIFGNEALKIEFAIIEMMHALLHDKLDEAEQKINAAKEFPVAKYPHLFYRFLRVIGMHKYLKGLYVESLDFYRQAFHMEEETKKVSLDSAYLFYDMALTYWQLNNYQRTYYYNQLAYNHFTELGNWYGLCESIMIYGVVYYYQNSFEKSLEQYKKALKLAEDISEKYLQATILHNIGLVYEKIEDNSKAHCYWQKALMLRNELKDKKNIAITLHSIAESNLKMEEYDNFILHMNLLTEILKECEYPLVEGKSFQLMGDYYRKLGEVSLFKSCYLKAIDCLTNGYLLLDSAELSFELAKELDDTTLFKQSAELYHKYHLQLTKI